jgi:hypothetical protein
VRLRRASAEGGEEAVEEEFLAAEDFFFGDGDGEPGAAIDFGDFDHAAGARWPLDLAGVADQGCGVEVALDGPGDDFFAAGLADDVEGDEVAVDGGAGFFMEFAAGGGEGVFVAFVLAFGDGPGVFFGPEGAAGMDEEDFDAVLGAAKEEDSGGTFVHGSQGYYRGSRGGMRGGATRRDWTSGFAPRDGGGSPSPLGRDCGKWLDPQGFAEGSFGLWQVTETGAVAGAFWQGVWGLPG